MCSKHRTLTFQSIYVFLFLSAVYWTWSTVYMGPLQYGGEQAKEPICQCNCLWSFKSYSTTCRWYPWFWLYQCQLLWWVPKTQCLCCYSGEYCLSCLYQLLSQWWIVKLGYHKGILLMLQLHWASSFVCIHLICRTLQELTLLLSSDDLLSFY